MAIKCKEARFKIKIKAIRNNCLFDTNELKLILIK